MPSRRARIFVACVVLQAGAACSFITDYSLSGESGRPPSEASADDVPDEKADEGSAPRDASAEVNAPACNENPCVVELAAAGQITCARTNDGVVRCWGLNNTGATGGGTAGDYAVPTKVAFDGPVDEISVGDWGNDDATACARRGALVECWGQDGKGRKLGRGGAVSDGDFVPVPAPVSGVVAALSLAVSSDRVCARVGGDRLSCWGKMYDSTIQPSAVNVIAPGPVTQIVGGRQHDCVLLESKEVACAGYPYSFKENWPDGGAGPGQAGFVRVGGVTGIVQIATMGNFVCALKAGGTVLC